MLVMLMTAVGFAQGKVDEIRKYLQAEQTEKVLVVSHRAHWRVAPENSLPAIQSCIDLGVDMVEIDLKKTKDGHLVIMHDRTIDRTTNGKGKISDYTLEELKAFRLKDKDGNLTEHAIPTFEEVMLLCKGKIMVNIDHAYDLFKEAYAVLEKTDTINHGLMKGNVPYARLKKDYPDLMNKVLFMPIVKLSEKNAAATIDEYLTHMKPIAFELVFDTYNEDVKHQIEKVYKSGSKVFLNTLWASLCAGHDDERAMKEGQDKHWGWILQQKARLIQTNRPVELLRYLKDKTPNRQ